MGTPHLKHFSRRLKFWTPHCEAQARLSEGVGLSTAPSKRGSRDPPGNPPRPRKVPGSGVAGGFGALAVILGPVNLPFTWSQICPQCQPLNSGIHNSPTSVTNCRLLRGTNSQKCPRQSPFGMFLFPKCTSLFRNLRYFYPSNPAAPLLPDSHPSFISRTGLDPAALEK